MLRFSRLLIHGPAHHACMPAVLDSDSISSQILLLHELEHGFPQECR